MDHLTKEDHVNKERFCSHCGEKKEGSQFISRSAKCRSCRATIWEKNKIAQGLDPQQIRRDNKNERRRAQALGIHDYRKNQPPSLKARAQRDHYEAREEEQKGLCGICGKIEDEQHMFKLKKLCRDHCHETGRWRGLLCKNCNAGLGLLGDSEEMLQAAIQYLRRWAATTAQPNA